MGIKNNLKLIASSVPFLNAFVQNQNGNLFSRIYRRPLIQGYSLPYEVFTPINNYEIYLINQSTSPMLLHNSSELASKTTEFTIDTKHHYYTTTINSVIGSNRTFTASVRDAILVDKIAFNDEFSVKQDNNDQQQLSSIQ
ncbi:unnamed protein product, partial [Rotaria magnacalcarata]